MKQNTKQKSSASLCVLLRNLRALYIIIGTTLILASGTYAQNPKVPQIDGSIRIRNLQIQQQQENLLLTFDAVVNEQAMNFRQSWSLIPELKAADESTITIFPTLLINGRQKERHYKRKINFQNIQLLDNLPTGRTHIVKHTDTTLTYTSSIPYQQWMDNSTLQINQVLTSSREKNQLFVIEDLKRFVQPECRIMELPPNFREPENKPKERQFQAAAYLDFPIGSSRILPDFRNNPSELARMSEDIAQVTQTEDFLIRNIYIEGYASPEGTYTNNQKLSSLRAAALREHLTTAHNLPVRLIKVSSVAEDWDGLRRLIEESNIENKTQIQTIITNNATTPDRKEAQLRALPPVWRTLLSEYFPHLRRVEYRIDYTIRHYNVEETRVLLTRNPERLSAWELYQVAMTYEEGSPQQEEIFALTVRMYPNDTTARHNLEEIRRIRKK